MEEQKLIQGIARKEASALRCAIDRFGGYVHAVVRRTVRGIGTAEDFEELACDVFVILWNNAARLAEDSVEVKKSRLTITAETYGDCTGTEMVTRDEGIITLNARNRAGLRTSSYDANTRIFTQVIDYYAATEDEVRNITTISVICSTFIGFDVDDAATQTFELTAGRPKD
jgi:hypothetical protein